MNYVIADEIIDQVRNELQGYFDSNMVDESLLYPEIRGCLEFLGTKVMPIKNMTFTVSNYCYTLPSDFHSLVLAMACTAYKVTVPDRVSNSSYEKTVTEIPSCTTPCEWCKDSNGNYYQVYQKFDTHSYVYRDIRNLRVNVESQGCDSDCINPTSRDKYDIEIKNGQLHTQFKEATIYMEYKSKLVSGEDLLVPDIYEVKEWIKFHLHYVLFRKLFKNADTDAQGRYQEAKQDANTWKEIARMKLKHHSYQEYMDLKAYLHREFNRHNYGIPNTLLRKSAKRFI